MCGSVVGFGSSFSRRQYSSFYMMPTGSIDCGLHDNISTHTALSSTTEKSRDHYYLRVCRLLFRSRNAWNPVGVGGAWRRAWKGILREQRGSRAGRLLIHLSGGEGLRGSDLAALDGRLSFWRPRQADDGDSRPMDCRMCQKRSR